MENYEKFSADEIIKKFLSSKERVVITSSFSINSVVILHKALKVRPYIPVILVDTELLFKETYDFTESLKAKWNLNLKILKSEISLKEQEVSFGEALWEKNPDLCCAMRKVKPLENFFEKENTDVWITGIRRDQSPTRKTIKKVEAHELPSGKRILKVAPLADWTLKDVWNYINKHKLPYNSLYDKGYTSFGCRVCTSLPSGEERSGRWKGKNKLECGLHTFTEKK